MAEDTKIMEIKEKEERTEVFFQEHARKHAFFFIDRRRTKYKLHTYNTCGQGQRRRKKLLTKTPQVSTYPLPRQSRREEEPPT
jgi:hypothetical protein